jgi:acid phosphatase type 7
MRRGSLSLLLLAAVAAVAATAVPAEPASTLSGPSRPVTVAIGDRGHAVDLPDTDPRVQRRVTGWAPEQIAVALSASPTSAWVSWITGTPPYKSKKKSHSLPWIPSSLPACRLQQSTSPPGAGTVAGSAHPFISLPAGDYQMGGAVEPLDPGAVGSVVRYGLAADALDHEATGESLVYSQLYPFEGLQNYTSGIIHHVRLQGLEPGTRYVYRCGDPAIPDAMSDVHAFRTMPAVGPGSYPERIAVVGDLGLTYNTTSTVDHLVRNRPDLVLLLGDVCYANLYLTNGTGADCYSCTFAKSTPIHETYQPRWDYWGR